MRLGLRLLQPVAPRRTLHLNFPSQQYPQRRLLPAPASSSALNVASDAVEADLGSQDHRKAARGADYVQLRRQKRGEASIVGGRWPSCETRCASSSKDLEMELYYASLVCILPNTTTAVRITAVRKTVLK